MPRHADEQSAIVTEVGWPPLLRVLHQGMQVLDHGVDVEALELLGIVEGFAHRVGGGRVRMEHADIEMLWPPVAVPGSMGAAGERALARAIVSLCVHVFLLSRLEFQGEAHTPHSASAAPSPLAAMRSVPRCRSLIGGGQPWLLFLPAGGAGRAFDQGKTAVALTWNNHVSPDPLDWCLSPNSLD